MKKILTIVTFVLSLMLIVNITLYNIVTIKIPDASAAFIPGNQTNQTNQTVNQTEIERIRAQTQAEQFAKQIDAFSSIIGTSVIAIGTMVTAPLIINMVLLYRQQAQTRGTNIRPFITNQLYRVLVAIGVIFTIVLILIYLNSMIWFNMGTQNPNNTALTALLETQKNFLTIVGTAFASLVAFYFGTRGSQGSNAERTTAITKPEAGQKALEVIDVNPIDGSIGIEVESPVTATFSAQVRSSSINPNTFSVKDANGNPVQGKIALTDNNTTIRFNPVSPLNRDSRYTVTITKGLMDISGASIAADKEWHFTTVV